MIKRFLFPEWAYDKGFSVFLLSLRIFLGGLLMWHGLQKFMNYEVLAAGAFPDLIGLGATVSVGLAIFAELFCSMAFVAGFLYRLSMIPMMVTMFVAFFFAHSGSVAVGELAFIYLVVFVLMYIAGPGRYSLDRVIAEKIYRKRLY